MATYDNSGATAEEIARKKLANMRTPVYAEGTPLANAQGNMNNVAASGMKPIATMADTLATNIGAKAVVNGIGSFMAPAVNRLASDRQANIQAQNTWQQTRSPEAANTQEIAREKLRFNPTLNSAPIPPTGTNDLGLTPSLSPDVKQSVFRSKNNSITQGEQAIDMPTQQQMTPPNTAVQSQFNWPAHQQINGSFTDAQGNTSSVNSTAREALNGMNSGNGINQGFTPNPNQAYTKNPNGSFTTNSGLNVEFDKSVPADRRQAFLTDPGPGPKQMDWRDSKSTVLMPASSSSGNSFQPSEPNYITVEKAREMGIGRKAMAAMNQNISNDFHANSQAQASRDNARTQALSSLNTAGINADANIQGHNISADAQRDVTGMQTFSPVNTAQAQNLGAQTTLHQQQAAQAQEVNKLTQELNTTKDPARRNELLTILGKRQQTVTAPYTIPSTDITRPDQHQTAIQMPDGSFKSVRDVVDGGIGGGIGGGQMQHPPIDVKNPTKEMTAYLANLAKTNPDEFARLRKQYNM